MRTLRHSLAGIGLLAASTDALAAVGGLLRQRGVFSMTSVDGVSLTSTTDVAEMANGGGGPSGDPGFDVRSLPGITAPLGFFDPLDFCGGDTSDGKIRFYREVEVRCSHLACGLLNLPCFPSFCLILPYCGILRGGPTVS